MDHRVGDYHSPDIEAGLNASGGLGNGPFYRLTGLSGSGPKAYINPARYEIDEVRSDEKTIALEALGIQTNF